MVRIDAIKMPDGSNFLAKCVAGKLETIRTERGLEIKEAALQCGLDHRRWTSFEEAAEIPEPDEIERITRWAFEGMSFRSYPLTKERKQRFVERGEGWKTHKFNCSKELDIRLMRAANRLQMQVSAFVQLCVESFLDRDNVISTYEEAARRIEEARAVDRVNADPYMQSFLSGDVDIAVGMGAKLREYKKAPKPQTHIDRLFEPRHSNEPDWDVVE